MQIEDNILWKIVTTYDLLYRMRKKFKTGDISWYEYSAFMEPKCIDVMGDLLKYMEMGDFLEYHKSNKELPEGTGYPGRDKYGFPTPSTSASVIRKYGELVNLRHEVQIETDPEKKTRELIIGFDTFVGWMHGTFEISRWVVKQSPFTGDWNVDYNIALDVMTIASGYGDAADAIQYLRDCQKANGQVKVDWALVRTNSKMMYERTS